MGVEQWFWMMNWCKNNKLAPTKKSVWERAKEEYKKQYIK
jgi:hypothetical protein